MSPFTSWESSNHGNAPDWNLFQRKQVSYDEFDDEQLSILDPAQNPRLAGSVAKRDADRLANEKSSPLANDHFVSPLQIFLQSMFWRRTTLGPFAWAIPIKRRRVNAFTPKTLPVP